MAADLRRQRRLTLARTTKRSPQTAMAPEGAIVDLRYAACCRGIDRLQTVRLLQLDEHVARRARARRRALRVHVLDVEVVRRRRLQDRVDARRATHGVDDRRLLAPDQ